MNLAQFKSTLSEANPPAAISEYLAALWQDGKGNWHASHNIAQEIDDREGSWIHAYLHRKEGDQGNAAYWYRRAARPMPSHTLEQEWDEMVIYFLARQA